MAYIRLTKHMREAFVRAVMNDVPEIDYNKQASDLVYATVNADIPPAIQKCLKDPILARWIVDRRYISMPGRLSNIPVQVPHTNTSLDFYLRAKYPTVWAELDEISALERKQADRRSDLRIKLTSAAESVTTRKALADLLPEFEKYLPAEPTAAIKSLPAIANVVSDFTAAGWPKNKGVRNAQTR